MPRANMPPNWQPPAPAWQSLWSETEDALVAGYFGIQSAKSRLRWTPGRDACVHGTPMLPSQWNEALLLTH